MLVIDNNCTDRTAAVVQSFVDQLPVRRVSESRQGTSIARNRAIREAVGEVLIFLDDDVRVRSGWLQAYRVAFADPTVMVACGRVIATWPDRLPPWIRGSATPPFNTIVPHYDLGDSPVDVTDRNFVPPTANAAFRREVFLKFGGFREDLGTIAGRRLGGEDTELMERLLTNLGAIRYVPDAQVDHPVERVRLSLWWNLAYLYGGGIGQSRYETPSLDTRTFLGIPIWTFRAILLSTYRVGSRFVVGDFREAAMAAGRVALLIGLVRGMCANRNR